MGRKVISCEFNIDTACVEVKYADGSMIFINCARVENEVARNMYEASELDWLVYNAPMDYMNLLLYGDIREYLKKCDIFSSSFFRNGGNHSMQYSALSILDYYGIVKIQNLKGG